MRRADEKYDYYSACRERLLSGGREVRAGGVVSPVIRRQRATVLQATRQPLPYAPCFLDEQGISPRRSYRGLLRNLYPNPRTVSM